jgi:hypothetical protein
MENEIEEENLEEMRRRVFDEMERKRAGSSVSTVEESDQYRKKQYKQRTPSPFQGSSGTRGRSRKRKLDMAEKEYRKKRHRENRYLYSDTIKRENDKLFSGTDSKCPKLFKVVQ